MHHTKVGRFPLEEAVRMSLLVQQHVHVGKQTISRGESQRVVRQQRRDLESVSLIARQGPQKDQGGPQRQKNNGQKVRAVARVLHEGRPNLCTEIKYERRNVPQKREDLDEPNEPKENDFRASDQTHKQRQTRKEEQYAQSKNDRIRDVPSKKMNDQH